MTRLNLNNGEYCQKRAEMKRGIVNSMRITISTLNLKGSSVIILGGLAAFRPVPSVSERVLCLLLLWDSDAGIGDSGEVCVRYVEPMSSLDCGSSEVASGGGFLDEEEVEECDKQYERGERIEHESRGKGQALSFCQRLIQLWLRS